MLETRTVPKGSKHEGMVAPNMEGLRPRGLRPQDLRPRGLRPYGVSRSLGLMLTVREAFGRSALCGKGEKSFRFFYNSAPVEVFILLRAYRLNLENIVNLVSIS